MFGIGFVEMLVIAVAILIFVGPKKMPEMMRQAGRFFVHMRRTATEVRSTFDGVIRDAEAEIRREEFDRIKKVMDDTRDTLSAPVKAVEYEPSHQHEDDPNHHSNSDSQYHENDSHQHHDDGHASQEPADIDHHGDHQTGHSIHTEQKTEK